MFYAATAIDDLAKQVFESVQRRARDWKSVVFAVQPHSAASLDWAKSSSDWAEMGSNNMVSGYGFRDLSGGQCPMWVKSLTADGLDDMSIQTARDEIRFIKEQIADPVERYDYSGDGQIALYAPMDRFMSGVGTIEAELFVSIRGANTDVNMKALWLAAYRIQAFCDRCGGKLRARIPDAYMASVMFAAVHDSCAPVFESEYCCD